jgi:hypothetical protein
LGAQRGTREKSQAGVGFELNVEQLRV